MGFSAPPNYLIERNELDAGKIGFSDVFDLCFNLNQLSDSTKQVLRSLSFFGNVNLLIDYFIQLVLGLNPNEDELNKISNELVFLAQSGWIKIHSNIIELHSSIADFLIFKLKPTLESCKDIITNLYGILDEMLDIEKQKLTSERSFGMAFYGDRILDKLYDENNYQIGVICNRLTQLGAFDRRKGLLYAKRYLDFVKKLYQNQINKNVEIANYNVGKMHFFLGENSEGLEYAFSAVQICESLPSTESNILDRTVNYELLALCSAMPNVCSMFINQYRVFDVLYKDFWKRLLLPHRPFFILSMHQLSVNALDESIKYGEMALEILKRSNIETHVDIPHILINLAACYWELGKRDEAIRAIYLCIEKSKGILGEFDIMVIKSIHNASAMMYQLKNLDEAKKLSAEANSIVEKYPFEQTQEFKEINDEVQKFKSHLIQNHS